MEPSGRWNLDNNSNIRVPARGSSLLDHNPGAEAREKRQIHIKPHGAIQRCKFYPWMLLVQKFCSLNKGADVTAAIAIKQKKTKLISTSRISSFLCPQNGIRKSRASINEIMTYVSGSAFFCSLLALTSLKRQSWFQVLRYFYSAFLKRY